MAEDLRGAPIVDSSHLRDARPRYVFSLGVALSHHHFPHHTSTTSTTQTRLELYLGVARSWSEILHGCDGMVVA
jgi:hypothetical protein